MHDIFVVLVTIVGFIALIWVTGAVLDNVEDRVTENRLRVLNEFIESGDHHLDFTIITLIAAELRSRMSMMGEYNVTVLHQALLNTIATNIYILTKANVRNQIHLLSVVCTQLNRRAEYTARLNITTNNRLELITQLGTDERLVYIKLHSINTLF
jgi:hypothetical protein